MPMRPCLDCGELCRGTRCLTHQRAKDRVTLRAKRERRPRIASEDDRRAAAVAEHRRVHGDWCPGWQCEPHPSTDLTADHPVAVGAGGDEGQTLAVLCRSCNGAKGAR